jgi:hypothetical protein
MSTRLSASLATFNDGFAQDKSTKEYALGVTGPGVGQSWVNVIGTRALVTTYTNSTGRPIMVAITTTPGPSVALVLRINSFGNSVDLDAGFNAGGSAVDGSPGFCVVIPIGAEYSVPISNYPISRWFELRT